MLLDQLSCVGYVDIFHSDGISHTKRILGECLLISSLPGKALRTLVLKAEPCRAIQLCPTLFLLFINDLPLSLNHCTTDFYADDSTLHISDKNKTQIETKLQSDSDQVTNWSKNNKMPINYNKTTIMTLGSRHNICKSEKININIDNHQIDTVSSHKLLGVSIDETLSWNPHIDYLCSVITSRITLLKQLSFYVPENIQKLFLSELHIAVDRLWLQLMGININYKH